MLYALHHISNHSEAYHIISNLYHIISYRTPIEIEEDGNEKSRRQKEVEVDQVEGHFAVLLKEEGVEDGQEGKERRDGCEYRLHHTVGGAQEAPDYVEGL